MRSWVERKLLTVNGLVARVDIDKVEGGYDVVITIPFLEKDTAEKCLKKLGKLEVTQCISQP